MSVDTQPTEPFSALAEALCSVNHAGSFCAGGRHRRSPPRLDILGFGDVSLPFTPRTKAALQKHSDPAPYGRGQETLVDAEVRSCRQIEATRIRLDPDWSDTLEEIAALAAEGLGTAGKVEARLYKLLLYGPGDFFLPHRDSEKEPGMFGTLVIALPSTFQGGELVVEHDEQQHTLSMQALSGAEVAWAAFYSDCRHELRPVTTGVRAVLVYNLVRARGTTPPVPSGRDVDRVEAELCRWVARGTPPKLCSVMSHSYSRAELSWEALKGKDKARAIALRTAAGRLGFEAYLAMIHIEESWSAEQLHPTGGYWGRRRWHHYDADPEPSEVDLIELHESTRVIRWADTSETGDHPLPFGDEELCPPGILDEEDPDEFHYHEATGNEGATVERTYLRAAVITWPLAHEVDVLAQMGAEALLEALASQRAGDSQIAAIARATAAELAHPSTEVDLLTRFFRELERLDDSAARRHWFDIGPAKQGTRVKAATVVSESLAHLDADDAGEQLRRIVLANGQRKLDATAALLALAPSHDRVAMAAEAVLDARPAYKWQARHRFDPSVLAELVMYALRIPNGAASAGLFRRVLARPDDFDFDRTVLPTVLRVADRLASAEALAPWAAFCVVELVARLRVRLSQPSNLSRSPAESCDCALCSELSAFLIAPNRSEWVLGVRQERRQHVESTIRRERLDVACETVRRGSPHKLRCTKTTASYEAKFAQRQLEQRALATLGQANLLKLPDADRKQRLHELGAIASVPNTSGAEIARTDQVDLWRDDLQRPPTSDGATRRLLR